MSTRPRGASGEPSRGRARRNHREPPRSRDESKRAPRSSTSGRSERSAPAAAGRGQSKRQRPSGSKPSKPKRTSADGTRARGRTTKASTGPGRPTPPVRDAKARRSIRLRAGIAGLAAIAFLFVFVFPTSSIWDQRNDIRDTQERIDLVRAEADQLEWELARLTDDDVVARLARERFHLVRPGETAWAVVPGPVTTPAEAGATGDETPVETEESTEPQPEPEPPLVP